MIVIMSVDCTIMMYSSSGSVGGGDGNCSKQKVRLPSHPTVHAPSLNEWQGELREESGNIYLE